MNIQSRILRFLFLTLFTFFILPGAPRALAGDTLVVIETSYGTIRLKLFEQTPLHRHNFIKLASQGFYDSLLFHRVIQNFMIQGGDPDSRRAPATAQLGNGSPGYTLPAEIVPGLFHKKGALAAARLGDDVNPEKRSSGSQFYIVQGRTFSDADLKVMEQRITNQNKQALFMKLLSKPENASLKQRFTENQKAQNRDSLQFLSTIAQKLVDAEAPVPFAFNEGQRKAYLEVGGTPHLDGGYTVFGEVLEGLDVIDRIALVEKNPSDRPLSDIRMKVRIEIVP